MCVCVVGETARCFNEAFVLVYSRCAGESESCMDGFVQLCVTTLSLCLCLPLSLTS